MERVSGELLKTLSVSDSVDTLRLLSSNQILSSVFPGLGVTGEDLAAIAAFESERILDILQPYYKNIDEYLTPSTSRQEIIQFLRKVKQDWVSVALYVYASLRSQGGQVRNAECRIPEIARVFYFDFLEIINQGGLINGNEVMRKYKVTPGVELGKILRYRRKQKL